MTPSDLLFISMAMSPIGGLLLAIPFAVMQLRYPNWVIFVVSVPLAYAQVLAVDALWSTLVRVRWWRSFLDGRRSPRVERLVASRGGFWITFLATPLVGPWAVMAFMRYANVRQRRVALPIALALACTSALLIGLCQGAPGWFRGR